MAVAANFATTIAMTLGLAACASAPGPDAADAPLRARVAIDSPLRTEQDRTMDASRRPVEFLAFTQVRPGMRVLDISAGSGYSSQLMALEVGATGVVFAQTPKFGDALMKRLADHPQSNLVLVKRPFEDPVPTESGALDLVTIILNYHDITYLPVDRKKMNARLFAALKSGGHLVVIDHAARSGAGITDAKTLHRIDEAAVRSEMADAGFVLESESNDWRNPADPRDQISAGGPVTSDKFALRFVKP